MAISPSATARTCSNCLNQSNLVLFQCIVSIPSLFYYQLAIWGNQLSAHPLFPTSVKTPQDFMKQNSRTPCTPRTASLVEAVFTSNAPTLWSEANLIFSQRQFEVQGLHHHIIQLYKVQTGLFRWSYRNSQHAEWTGPQGASSIFSSFFAFVVAVPFPLSEVR